MTKTCTTQYLLRSVTHGLSMAHLHNVARAFVGPPGICKWESFYICDPILQSES